jgi:hypothetical protein
MRSIHPNSKVCGFIGLENMLVIPGVVHWFLVKEVMEQSIGFTGCKGPLLRNFWKYQWSVLTERTCRYSMWTGVNKTTPALIFPTSFLLHFLRPRFCFMDCFSFVSVKVFKSL